MGTKLELEYNRLDSMQGCGKSLDRDSHNTGRGGGGGGEGWLGSVEHCE